MSQGSRWRQRAAEIITRVLRRWPNLSVRETRKKLREAYPFSSRSGWQYQCWLVEVREALIAVAKLRGEPLPKPTQSRSRKRRDVPGQLMLWGGGVARAA